jgi:hypothetical protein
MEFTVAFINTGNNNFSTDITKICIANSLMLDLRLKASIQFRLLKVTLKDNKQTKNDCTPPTHFEHATSFNSRFRFKKYDHGNLHNTKCIFI